MVVILCKLSGSGIRYERTMDFSTRRTRKHSRSYSASIDEEADGPDQLAALHPRGAVSQGAQADYFAQVKGRSAAVLATRYFDANIRGETARSQVIRYILRNPVKRGLVASPELYRWSSFNHYATGIRGPVEIESEWTAQLSGPLIAIKPR
jgi:hypothetical protein